MTCMLSHYVLGDTGLTLYAQEVVTNPRIIISLNASRLRLLAD